MRGTEVLQGLRVMKFVEFWGRWRQRRLSQAEAAELLGMNERTFRRWRERYDAEGLEGLLDRPWARRPRGGCRSISSTRCCAWIASATADSPPSTSTTSCAGTTVSCSAIPGPS
jgi:hypothetical protein